MGKVEDRREALEKRIAASKTVETLDDGLIAAFGAAAQSKLAARLPLFESIKVKLQPGSPISLGGIDQHAKNTVNRATPQMRDDDKIAFREVVVECWEEALVTTGKKVAVAPAVPAAPPTVPSSVSRLPRWSDVVTSIHRPPPTAPSLSTREQGKTVPAPHPGKLAELIAGYQIDSYHERDGSSGRKPVQVTVPLAFHYKDRNVCDRFARLFHQFEAPWPYKGLNGREAFRNGLNDWVNIESHYGLSNNTCWLEFSVYDESGKYLRRADDWEAHTAKQFSLHLLLTDGLITPELAREAGYQESSIGAGCAKGQLAEMRRNQTEARSGSGWERR